MLSAQCPVGVIDSGLGGLSVLRALRQELPAENFIYCADSGNAPWGDKTGQWVRNRCDTIAHWFLDVHHVKMLVLARHGRRSRSFKRMVSRTSRGH